MTRLPGHRHILLGGAAGTSAVACVAAVLTGSLLAAVFAASSAILILGSLAVGRRQGSAARGDLLRQATEHAETGRRLAIYERETGLLAHWYISLRGKEECDRAARYQRPLALLLAEPQEESDAWTVQGLLADWFRRQARDTDIAGFLGNGRFVLMMPETDIAAARKAAGRLQRDVDGVETSLSAFGVDGVTFDELYAAAWQSFREPRSQAA